MDTPAAHAADAGEACCDSQAAEAGEGCTLSTSFGGSDTEDGPRPGPPAAEGPQAAATPSSSARPARGAAEAAAEAAGEAEGPRPAEAAGARGAEGEAEGPLPAQAAADGGAEGEAEGEAEGAEGPRQWGPRPAEAAAARGALASGAEGAACTPLRSQAVPYISVVSHVMATRASLASGGDQGPSFSGHGGQGAHDFFVGDGFNSDDRTTIMMCNIPLSYTRDILMDMLNACGWRTFYDFVYVPVNFVCMRGVGYAFVNLVSPEQAKTFFLLFDGFEGWEYSTANACRIQWSDVQGLQENILRYQNSPIMNEDVPSICKPALLRNGVLVPFPEPTKALRAFRHRKGNKIS